MRRRITIAVLGVAGLFLVFLGLKYFQFKREVGVSYFKFRKEVRRATSYRPACSDADAACAVWTQFRHAHPFPYQSIAGKRSSDGNLILIVSEPSPRLTRRQLDVLIKALFGSELVSFQRLRWY